MITVLKVFAGLVFILILAVGIFIWLGTYWPEARSTVEVACDSTAVELQAGQKLKVLSWNVQYMAGKGYVFYYDLPNDRGPDVRPTSESLAKTLDAVARVIEEENPDIVLLQEMDEGAGRSDFKDQTHELQRRLKRPYPCRAEAFYWKGWFVPHPKIMGPVGMKLVTLSRYRMENGLRHQLPLMTNPWWKEPFYLKRAVLEVAIPRADHSVPLRVLNTHLDAFAQGTDTMERQVRAIDGILGPLDGPWVLGGDFNLLMPDARNLLPETEQSGFSAPSELAVLSEKYLSVPSGQDVVGEDRESWFTHFPNDPVTAGPDRTIDYIFHSPELQVTERRVRSADILNTSDHYPVILGVEVK